MTRSRLIRVIAALTAGAAPAASAGCGSTDGDCVDAMTSATDVPASGATAADGGALTCEAVCGGEPFAMLTSCTLGEGDGGQVAHCTWTTPAHCGPLTGRRPPGLQAAPQQAASELGALFRGYAYLEAASVPAFARVARELSVHGAPRRLVRGASRAARDERSHARTMRRLARRHGAAPPRTRVPRSALRSLEALAIDNEAEGCVRETFGALLAAFQARAAGDPAVRDAMASVAPDEARHAALAWSIARWARARLDAPARARVDEARRAAIAELRAELAAEPSLVVAARAGVPSAAQARSLLDSLLAALGAG